MNLKPVTLVDGLRSEVIPVTDRGLQYGDGVWETMAVQDGRVLCLEQHLRRLQAGCKAIGINDLKLRRIEQETSSLAARAGAARAGAARAGTARAGTARAGTARAGTARTGTARAEAARAERAVIKIILTRGSGGRGYRPPSPGSSRRVIMLQQWPQHPASWYQRGIKMLLLRTRLPLQPALAGFKHLNCMPQILARNEWHDDSIAEGIMRDEDGNIIEGTMSNIFMRIGNSWLTPKLDRCGVAGIVRAEVIRLAKDKGVTIRQRRIPLSLLQQAEEIFVSNSIIGLWSVRSLLLPQHKLEFAPGQFTSLMRRGLRAARVIM